MRCAVLCSGCLKDCFSNGVGQCDGHKELLGVKIILTGFVDHPDVTMFGSESIEKRYVEFSLFQRRGVAFVFHTD